MSKNVRIYDVFISSPSDVSSERDVVQDAIDTINQINGAKENYRLNALRWEKDVSSQFGNHPQKIINEQIGNDYDIFVGIICTRFGTETENYNSGTEEEFHRALERKNGDGAGPEILFFFKDPRKSEVPIDAEQFLKVSKFKKSVQSIGVYEEFEASDVLKTSLMAALVKAIDRLKKSEKMNAEMASEKYEVVGDFQSKNALILIDDFDEDIGLIDLTDFVQDSIERFTDIMEVMTDATERFGGRVTLRTDDLKSMRPSGNERDDRKAAKIIIEKVAAEMQRYAQIVEDATPEARSEFSSALKGMQRAVLISNQDGLSAQDDVLALMVHLATLKSELGTVIDQVSGFRDAMSSTPRMTSKLNQAKKRTINAISELLSFLLEASANIDTTLEAIKQ